jgi:hypothetical protein
MTRALLISAIDKHIQAQTAAYRIYQAHAGPETFQHRRCKRCYSKGAHLFWGSLDRAAIIIS